jgi:lysophospholipase L1-like esterase
VIPIAREAGFLVRDLRSWTHSREGLFRVEEDYHPNAKGHQVIAEELMKMLQEFPDTVPLR